MFLVLRVTATLSITSGVVH